MDKFTVGAVRLGIGLSTASEGFGHAHHLYSAGFFELGEQPVEVMMAVSAEDAQRLFARLREEKSMCFASRPQSNSV